MNETIDIIEFADAKLDLRSAPRTKWRDLGHFEQAKADVEQAMRLSPRDPRTGPWHNNLADAELGLGHFDAAIEDANKPIDAGFKVFWVYLNLATAHVLKGEIGEAKPAMAEARSLNPLLSVKWLMF